MATGLGGAIYGHVSAQFNRFSGNSDKNGYTIYGNGDATNNWWGSNDSPATKVSANVIYSPWIVLNITCKTQ